MYSKRIHFVEEEKHGVIQKLHTIGMRFFAFQFCLNVCVGVFVTDHWDTV